MGIGVWELVLLFSIVLLIFGTKKLRTLGGDLGGAIHGFRKAMHENEDGKPPVGGSDADSGHAARPEAAEPKA